MDTAESITPIQSSRAPVVTLHTLKSTRWSNYIQGNGCEMKLYLFGKRGIKLTRIIRSWALVIISLPSPLETAHRTDASWWRSRTFCIEVSVTRNTHNVLSHPSTRNKSSRSARSLSAQIYVLWKDNTSFNIRSLHIDNTSMFNTTLCVQPKEGSDSTTIKLSYSTLLPIFLKKKKKMIRQTFPLIYKKINTKIWSRLNTKKYKNFIPN